MSRSPRTLWSLVESIPQSPPRTSVRRSLRQTPPQNIEQLLDFTAGPPKLDRQTATALVLAMASGEPVRLKYWDFDGRLPGFACASILRVVAAYAEYSREGGPQTPPPRVTSFGSRLWWCQIWPCVRGYLSYVIGGHRVIVPPTADWSEITAVFWPIRPVIQFPGHWQAPLPAASSDASLPVSEGRERCIVLTPPPTT